MAWTTPGTAVAGSVLTAAFLNEQLRDNMLALDPLRNFLNWDYDEVNTSQSRNNQDYGDLATVGPTVTVTTGTHALVFWHCFINLNSAGNEGKVDIDISGATTSAASGENRMSFSSASNSYVTLTSFKVFTNLTAGANTFTLKYGSTGTVNFLYRRLLVVSLPV